MKVGIIQNVTLNDHRSVYSHNVACKLAERGIDVDLILQKTGEELQYQSRPYTLVQIPGGTYSISGQLKFMAASHAVLKRGHYDIIHGKNPFSSIAAAVFLRKTGLLCTKLLYDTRGLWIDFGVKSGRISPWLAQIFKKMEIKLTKQCDYVVVISPALKEVLCSRGIEQKKISVVFGDGVDITKIESIPPAQKNKDAILIGYIGSISTARQSEKIISAFKYINRKDVQLMMIGPVLEPDIFKKLTSDCENIVLTGYLPQEKAFQFLKSFDVVVSYHDTDHPVYNVAVPTKIFEYMAAGVPIVATTHAMYTNILEHKKTAFLTKQTPEGFAKGMAYILDNPNIAKKLAENARVQVEKYSIQRVVDQLEAVYRHL